MFAGVRQIAIFKCLTTQVAIAQKSSPQLFWHPGYVATWEQPSSSLKVSCSCRRPAIILDIRYFDARFGQQSLQSIHLRPRPSISPKLALTNPSVSVYKGRETKSRTAISESNNIKQYNIRMQYNHHLWRPLTTSPISCLTTFQPSCSKVFTKVGRITLTPLDECVPRPVIILSGRDAETHPSSKTSLAIICDSKTVQQCRSIVS